MLILLATDWRSTIRFLCLPMSRNAVPMSWCPLISYGRPLSIRTQHFRWLQNPKWFSFCGPEPHLRYRFKLPCRRSARTSSSGIVPSPTSFACDSWSLPSTVLTIFHEHRFRTEVLSEFDIIMQWSLDHNVVVTPWNLVLLLAQFCTPTYGFCTDDRKFHADNTMIEI